MNFALKRAPTSFAERGTYTVDGNYLLIEGSGETVKQFSLSMEIIFN